MTSVLYVICPWLAPDASCLLPKQHRPCGPTLFSNVGMLSRRRSRTLMSIESFMNLRNGRISLGAELFPVDVLDKAVKKLSKVLHDEAIRKEVSRVKPASCGNKLHFSATPHQQQHSQQQQSKKLAMSSVGLSFRSSSLTSSSSKSPSSSSHWGKKKKF